MTRFSHGTNCCIAQHNVRGTGYIENSLPFTSYLALAIAVPIKLYFASNLKSKYKKYYLISISYKQ